MAIVYENELKFGLLKTGTSKLIGSNYKSIFTNPYRFSVSKLTMLLSDVTIILWILFWFKDIYKLYKNNNIFFDFCCHSEIHFFTLFIIFFHFIIGLYIFQFFKRGKVFYKNESD